MLGACSGPRTTSPDISDADALAEAQKQRQLVVERQLRDNRRLWDVGYPLLAEGAALCGEALVPSIGMRALARQDIEGENATLMATVLGLTDRPEVIQVMPGSPAEDAGVEAGDVLMEIGTEPLPTGRDAELLERLLDKATVVGEPLTLKVRRGEETLYLNPVPEEICDYTLVLTDSEKINAYADGEQIIMTRGMMRFAQTDQHLAVVVGHELAHNAMEHSDAKETNSVAAGAGGLLLDIGLAVLGVNTGGAFMKAAAQAGGAAYSVEFEQEADYIGLYFLARAGYPLEGAADIWRLMAVENPNAIDHSSSHPTTPERFLALEQAIEEIETKRQNGEDLLPEVLPEPSANDGSNTLLKNEYPE